MKKVEEVRKYLVAVATVLSQALALGVLPSPVDKYAVCVIGVLGALGVYQVPNADQVPKEA